MGILDSINVRREVGSLDAELYWQRLAWIRGDVTVQYLDCTGSASLHVKSRFLIDEWSRISNWKFSAIMGLKVDEDELIFAGFR